ncbi:hypothetical protein [Streptomyces sp. S.PB5]|uniref:hypothetical protein n=1 Tax=Streptomyces sp. S.PB5 TaxID=3020844 RepID=UPI0025AF3E44|nr:hypothetical protein [Streptomyces sp. S.PB5]MDN3023861.1 hypothetical protein [Streptomyces sp. S.PB5]
MSSTRTWLRAFVLLLALLVPGAHADAAATTLTPVVAEIAEYDVLDTALRPPARAALRPAVPLRPAPGPAPAFPARAVRPAPAPPRPPYALPALRSTVLRC